MIVGLHHVALGVPDFERGLAFYRDVLGFEVVEEAEFKRDNPDADRAIGLREVAAKMAMLKMPNAYLELWQYTNPAPEDRRQRPCDLGYPHFALQVDGLEQEYARLVAAGMEFVGAAGRLRPRVGDLRPRSVRQRDRTVRDSRCADCATRTRIMMQPPAAESREMDAP